MKITRKIFSAIIFSLLTIPLFAQPGEGGGPGDDGGHDFGGDSWDGGHDFGGGPGDDNHWAGSGFDDHGFGNHGFDGPRDGDGGNASPNASNSYSFDDKNSFNGRGGTSRSGRRSSIPSVSTEAGGNIINYRGNRVLSSSDSFLIENVKAESTSKYSLNIEIRFNQSINPLSISSDSILVNGEKISDKSKFSFSKKGDTIRVAVPKTKDSYSILVQNVESFDGIKLKPIIVNNLTIESGGS